MLVVQQSAGDGEEDSVQGNVGVGPPEKSPPASCRWSGSPSSQQSVLEGLQSAEHWLYGGKGNEADMKVLDEEGLYDLHNHHITNMLPEIIIQTMCI